MFKFLRKYNKFILAVGGSLLVIVFLIPQAMTALSQRAALSSASVATFKGEGISPLEWQNVQAEVAILDDLGIVVIPLGKIETPEHWFLLTEEATELGLIGGPLTANIPPEQLAQLRAVTGQRGDFIEKTLAKWQGVQRMMSMYLNAAQFSDRRLQNQSEELFHQINVQPVVLQPTADNTDYEPTESEIQEQMEQFADIVPGEGEMGFGYKLPNRAKIEWIAMSAADVREQITSGDGVDSVALRRYWRENESDPSIPAVVSGGDIPEAVREAYIDEQVREKIDVVAKEMYRRLSARHRSLPKRDNFVVLPDDWAQQRLDLQELGSELAEKYELPAPAYHASGDEWRSVQEIAELEGVGMASTEKFGRRMATSALVGAAKEFGGVTLPIQEGVAPPPVRGTNGSLYIFRITATDPARPPKSVDEVREQVVIDLKMRHAYEQIVANIDAIREKAINDGLLAVAMEYDQSVQTRATLSRIDRRIFRAFESQGGGLRQQPTPLPVIGQDEETLKEIIKTAMAVPKDATVTDLPESDRIMVVPAPDKLAVLVLRLLNQQPFSRELYEELAGNNKLQTMLLTNELSNAEDVQAEFSQESLASRHEFVMNRRDTEEDEALTDEVPADAQAAATGE